MYLVMKLHKWSDASVTLGGLEVPIVRLDSNSIGFMEVFESEEEAREFGEVVGVEPKDDGVGL